LPKSPGASGKLRLEARGATSKKQPRQPDRRLAFALHEWAWGELNYRPHAYQATNGRAPALTGAH